MYDDGDISMSSGSNSDDGGEVMIDADTGYSQLVFDSDLEMGDDESENEQPGGVFV